ncbi:MAG TPA: flagellar hook-basal body complex protein [Steroidobacter sp.]|nr:flagellar hook-basal body complex protein [Steroidobacteraceae bacterium]HLS81618.1 flagellar hook-basal body complex protein [Steroidobacter sp.]
MSFNIALSGINAINTELETISNNIANAGTFGFKASRANFASMYAGSQPAGTQVSSLTQSIDIGGGVLTTGRGLDASIQERGFFVTRDSSGTEVYTRVGIFAADKDGYIIDSFGRRAQGYAQLFDANGRPIEGAGLGALGDLQVRTGQIPAVATENLRYTANNLSADWEIRTVAFDPQDPITYNSSIVSVVYDSLGQRHTLTQYFVKTANNEVTIHYGFDGAQVAGVNTVLGFGTNGQLDTINGAAAPMPPPPVPADWRPVFPAVAINLGTPAGAAALTVNVDYNDTTQFAGEAVTINNTPDGYASGTLTSVQIEEDGSVMGVYSNGVKQRVGTLALATFANEGALKPISETAWTTTNESGQALYSTPGVGQAGRLTPGALEQSNVDMTEELVKLMSSQRNYQANTKVIATQNEMMQTLMQAV